MRTYSCALVLVLSCMLSVSVFSTENSIHSEWVNAIQHDRTDLLANLLETHKKSATLVQIFASNGKGALMVACKKGDQALAKNLVIVGADINRTTSTGGTPFMFAALGDNLAIAKWLYAQGVDINGQGTNGWSAVMIASAKGQAVLLAWLLSIGADINAADVYRLTPLMRAVDNEQLAAVNVLLADSAVEVNSLDESDSSALHYAVANKNKIVVALLLAHGADPNLVNRKGLTPLAMASELPDILPLLNARH